MRLDQAARSLFLTEFVAALQRAAPHLTPQEVVWRYYWIGGSLMVSLAVPPGMVEPLSNGKARTNSGSDDLARGLIAFLVQGFGRAPSLRAEERRVRRS